MFTPQAKWIAQVIRHSIDLIAAAERHRVTVVDSYDTSIFGDAATLD